MKKFWNHSLKIQEISKLIFQWSSSSNLQRVVLKQYYEMLKFLWFQTVVILDIYIFGTLSCCVSLFLTETFSSQPSTYCVKQTDVEYYQPKGERPLNRDNIGLLAKFADRNRPEKLLCVATTHLLYNPRRVDVRLAQIAVMLAGMYYILEAR